MISVRSRLAALRGWRADGAAALLGVLSAAALPPVHAIPVLLLAVPGLLVLLGEKPGWRGAAWTGFWFGFGHHLIGLYWITEAILVESARFWWLVPLAVPALAVVMALFIALPCALARLAPAGTSRVFVLAGSWVLADLARQFIATGFPWNLWGSVWEVPGAFGDAFIQPAAWVSVHGMTLATLLLAATPVLGRRAMAVGSVVVVAWGAAGWWRLEQPAPVPPGMSVVLVQGNVPQGQKWNQAFVNETFDRDLRLTREGVAQTQGRPTVVVWPETASFFLLDTDVAARNAIVQAAGVPALIGGIRFDAERRPRNSLLAIDGDGPPVAVYDKWHLVPFGEYVPAWLPLAFQVVPGGGFARGPGPGNLTVPGVPTVGVLICYEAIFPGQVVGSDRPDWLVNVTNDAWFGNSTGPRQHLAAARMRAVEEGLPLLRAANTGISAAFDAFGRERARLGMNQTGVLVVDLPGKLAATPFARGGLAIPLGLAVVVTGLGVVLARRR